MISRIDSNDIAQILKHDHSSRDTTCYQADKKDKQTKILGLSDKIIPNLFFLYHKPNKVRLNAFCLFFNPFHLTE